MNLTQQSLARIAGLLSGAVYGIYWLPLRNIESAGFEGPWATFVFNLFPAIIAIPFALSHIRDFAPRRFRFHLGGVLIGFAIVLYATSFLYTEVVRTQLLFYVMPLWGFLLARFVLGDPITPVRWLSIAIGIAGLLVILEADSGFPWPRNIGDWMALVAGVIWACGSLTLMTDKDSHVNSYCLAFFIWGAVFSFAIGSALVSFDTIAPLQFDRLLSLWWYALIALFVVAPAGWATVYAAQILNPGLLGLLFMAEISVATITASVLAGEPFGLRELLGVVLITMAGVLEPLTELRQRQSVPKEG